VLVKAKQKPRALPRLSQAFLVFVQRVLFVVVFLAVAFVAVSSSAQSPSSLVGFVSCIAISTGCWLSISAALRLWRCIRQAQSAVDAFTDRERRMRQEFDAERKTLIAERDALREEKNRLLKRLLSHAPDPD
jgi:hypothetical protein